MLSGLALTDQGFKNSFKHSSVGLVILNLSGNFTETNDAFRNMIGLSELEVLKIGFQSITHIDDLGNCLLQVNRLVRGEIQSFLAEKRYQHKNGHYVWTRSNVSLMKDESGNPISIVSIVQNIDDIKRSEEMLKEAMRHRDNFLMIASHELRTPVATIKLSAQMLKRILTSADDPKIMIKKIEKLNELTDEGMNRMGRLIDNMLDISRIQEGKLNLQKEVIDAGSLLKNVCMYFDEALRNAGIIPHYEIEESVFITADSYRLEQAFTNILLNCIQHAEGSKLFVTLKMCGDKTAISFRDTGPGIPIKDQNKVFMRYQKLSPSKSGGLGLGLFITRNILNDHGGNIELVSKPGCGTEFLIALPCFHLERSFREIVASI